MLSNRASSLKLKALLVLVLITHANAWALTPFEQAAREAIASNFVTAALVSDEEVIRLGFWNFDPNQLLGTDDDNLGTDQALNTRDSLKQFSLPWKWQLRPHAENDRFWILSKISYLDVEQETRVAFSEQKQNDEIDQSVISLGTGVGYLKSLDEHWQFQLETNLSWMRYRNKVTFNSLESQAIAPLIDDVITNITTDVVMMEPVAGVNYLWSYGSAHFKAFSKYHYLRGQAINPDVPAHDVEPEAWYWSNGIAIRKPITRWNQQGDHNLWLRLARVDVGGDIGDQLGATHYYELGIGWLMDTRNHFELLDNVGIGIDVNYGSELRGGTLMLMFNVDFF